MSEHHRHLGVAELVTDPAHRHVRVDQRLREMNQRLANLEQAVRHNQAPDERSPGR
jgi:hypothetical protein